MAVSLVLFFHWLDLFPGLAAGGSVDKESDITLEL